MADWKKGDLALCVNAGRVYFPRGYSNANPAIRKGAIYTVDWVGNDGLSVPHPCLGLAGTRSNAPLGGFAQVRFRKVTPPKADQFDREVIDLMAGKKVPA